MSNIDRKIAVVIPTYNGVNIVDRCIKALQQSTIKPDIILCVDDYSKDGTPEHVKKYFPNVKILINEQNLGASESYARGIRYCYFNSYERIWLLDQDDIPIITALEEIIYFADKVGTNFVPFSMLVDEKSRYIYPMLTQYNLENTLMIKGYYEVELANFAGMLLNIDQIKRVKFPLKILTMDGGDWEYCLRLKNKGFSLIVNSKSVVYHNEGFPVVLKLPIAIPYLAYEGKIIKKYSKYHLINLTLSNKRILSKTSNYFLILNLPYIKNFHKTFILKCFLFNFIKIILFNRDKITNLKFFIKGLSSGLIKKKLIISKLNCI
jgi:glycosyltransferase involved in cell wall biosynthesis